MLLTLTTTHRPATDLGYLLHKHPERVHVPLTFGNAHVFYPEATEERCTAVLLLEVDPVGLSRRRPDDASSLAVRQRSALRRVVAPVVAIAEVFGRAGRARGPNSPHRDAARGRLPACPCAVARSRPAAVRAARVRGRRRADPARRIRVGRVRYFACGSPATVRLADLLAHLYVLVPVLDDEKHYWVGDDEVEKLLRHGDGWLAAHPEHDLITPGT